ncbi:MAG: GAF domain-containing sensor histidine kinase, partial [Candidatus Binatia bacterium]
FFNRAAATSLGYQAETLVGTSLRDFLTPTQQGQFGKYLQQLPLDTSMDGVLQLFTSTGSLRNFRYRNSLHKVAGYPLYVRIQLQDPFGQRLGDDHKGVIYSIPQSQREPKGSLFTVNSALQSELLHYRETRNTLLRDREELERRIAARTVELTQTHLLLEQETLERARLERALDESEVRYRTLFENASEGTAALARTLKALTAERALDSFLSNILKKITQHLRARWAQLWLYRASQETMLLHMSLQDGTTLSPRERHALSQSPDVPESPLWREILQASCPIIIHDITQPTPLVNSASLLEQGVRTVILVPLLLEDEVSGYLSVQTSDQQEYQTEELLLAQALAQQMTLALQLSGFANERQQAAILEERNRLAREIHDTIAQGLTGILLQLEAAQEGLTSAPETVQTYLTRATTLAQTSLAEARRSVMALHPQALENDDLPTALNRTASEISTHTNTEITVHIHGTPYPLSSEIAANLLRIGQEAIINACKHAQPKVISLNLSFMTNELQLQIHDDGQGFDMTYPSRSSGFGLTSMRERAEQIGGQFTISSLPGQGTQITVSIPVSHFSSGELSL